MDYFDPFAEDNVDAPHTRFLLVSFDSDWRFGTEHSEYIVAAAERASAPTSATTRSPRRGATTRS